MKPAGPCQDTTRGFTLLETIVVLVILGLALTIVAGFLPRRNPTLELSAATSRASSALRLARARAMAEGRVVPVVAIPDGHGLRIDATALSLGPSVTVRFAEPRILFEPDGSASGGSLSLQVEQRRRIIQIDWLTGRVSVADAS
jgi:general secretion pathway protein H